MTKLLKPHYEEVDQSVEVPKKPRQKTAPERPPIRLRRVKPGSMKFVKVKQESRKSANKRNDRKTATEDPTIAKEELNLAEPLKEARTIVLKSVLG